MQTNALVLLKKGPVFSIATFFRKMFFWRKRETLQKKEISKEEIVECKKALEEKRITTKELSQEQIKLLEELYQNQIQEIEHKIKLIEARNQMCRFRIRMHEKEVHSDI